VTRGAVDGSHPQFAQEAAERAYAWRLLSVTSIGVVLVFVNGSSMDVALPAVSRGLHASSLQSSWFLLSYMLVNTILILLFGRLSDMYGRRMFYLGGLAALTLASIGCALAPSASWLIALRAAQGAGAAAVVTNTTALLTDAFPAGLLSRGLGINAGVAAAAQVLGPLVGGLCIDQFGWRWIFGLNVPVGTIGLAWAAATLRPVRKRPDTGSFDVIGAVLIAAGLAGLVLGLSQAASSSWTSPSVLLAGLVAVIAIPAFVVVESKRAQPLLELKLIADRARGAAYFASFLMSISQFAVVLLMSLYLQLVLGYGALAAGVRVVPMALGIMLTAPVAGRLSQRLSSRLLSTAGLIMVALGLLSLWLILSEDTAYVGLALALFVVGVGTGLFMTPNTSYLMASLPANRRGIGNGIRSTMQNAGFVLSTAVSLAILTAYLPASQRASGFATRVGLSAPQVQRFVVGERVALLVLVALALAGALVSALRSSSVSQSSEMSLP
jgi:EmrB/QacA subfamily drug resistance transporter